MEVEDELQKPQAASLAGNIELLEEHEQDLVEGLGSALRENIEREAGNVWSAEQQNVSSDDPAGVQQSTLGLEDPLQLEPEPSVESKDRKESGDDDEARLEKHKQHGAECEVETAPSLVNESAVAGSSVNESASGRGSGSMSNADAMEEQPLGESCTEGPASAAPPSTSTRPDSVEEGHQTERESQPPPVERPPLTMADVQGLLSDFRSAKRRKKTKPPSKETPKEPPKRTHPQPFVTTAPQPVMNYWPRGPLPYLPFPPLQPQLPPLPKLKHQPPQFVPAPFEGYFGPPAQAAPSHNPPPLGFFPVHPPLPADGLPHMPASCPPPPKQQEGSHPTAISNHRMVKMLACKCKRLTNGGAERPDGANDTEGIKKTEGVREIDGVNGAVTSTEPACTCDVHKLCKGIGPMPLREDVAKALADFKHDGTVRGRKEEAIRQFLSQVILQVVGHNVMTLRKLTTLAEAANANAGCGTEKGASMSARPEGVYNLVCNCLQLKPATASERALGTILLPTHCVTASPFIFKLMKELQQSKRSKSKKENT